MLYLLTSTLFYGILNRYIFTINSVSPLGQVAKCFEMAYFEKKHSGPDAELSTLLWSFGRHDDQSARIGPKQFAMVQTTGRVGADSPLSANNSDLIYARKIALNQHLIYASHGAKKATNFYFSFLILNLVFNFKC